MLPPLFSSPPYILTTHMAMLYMAVEVCFRKHNGSLETGVILFLIIVVVVVLSACTCSCNLPMEGHFVNVMPPHKTAYRQAALHGHRSHPVKAPQRASTCVIKDEKCYLCSMRVLLW